MKNTALLTLVAASALFIGGCKKDKAPAPAAATPPAEEIVPQAQPYVPANPPMSYTEVTPAPAAPVAAEPAVTAAPAASGGRITGTSYTIQKGDTLYSIAQRRYGSGTQWKKIAAANPNVNPNKIIPGTKLKLPN
jgi:5'-nucleotidase